MNWQPTASIENLQKRAQIIARIRQFFAKRNVLEVDTPLLDRATVTDLHLHSLKTNCQNVGELYLQTSPEFAMKRLLASDSGSIYQICKSFRDDEIGRYHNPEFTMLEWYRLWFTHHDLMDEMDEFLQFILNCPSAIRYTYQKVFEKHLGINPHATSAKQLYECTIQNGISDVSGIDKADRDVWLQLLMSHCVEPRLEKDRPIFIYDYPASQAALAKIRQEKFPVAERFEVYVDGVELANGFNELTDAKEQRKRFEDDLKKRQEAGYPKVPIDENLLAALESGLPECAGVALGVDRLIMLALNERSIGGVLSFSAKT
jgi:elongation factor P--(R)-beta-lysine ligase